MHSKDWKRARSYYASSGHTDKEISLGNGRTYQGKDNDRYKDDHNENYDDGYDDNYPSPAYTMGSGNFNAGRRNDYDTANMFKPDNRYEEDEDDHSGRYDNNYYEEDDFDDDHRYGEHRTGRYDHGYLNTRNREGQSGLDRERIDAKRNNHRYEHEKESYYAGKKYDQDTTDEWIEYYDRAYNGANSSHYNYKNQHSSREEYAGTLRRKRPYL